MAYFTTGFQFVVSKAAMCRFSLHCKYANVTFALVKLLSGDVITFNPRTSEADAGGSL